MAGNVGMSITLGSEHMNTLLEIFYNKDKNIIGFAMRPKEPNADFDGYDYFEADATEFMAAFKKITE